MLDWILRVGAVLRAMRTKATDAASLIGKGKPAEAKIIEGYLRVDYESLKSLWSEQGLKHRDLDNLGRHIRFGELNDYENILARDIPQAEVIAENHARAQGETQATHGFEEMLHPVVRNCSMMLYTNGHYRESVINSIVAIFDLIRERTGLAQDGAALAGEAFSLDRARLVFSEIESESGKSDQKGFMQIIQGMYLGIRNPKSHSLAHDLDKEKTAQYLVFSSLIARRVTEAKVIE